MGANSAPYCTPEKMVDQLLGLKKLSCRNFQLVIIISNPTLRTDNAILRKNI